MGTDDQIAMARRISASVWESNPPAARKILDGQWDNGEHVRIALAAIIETRAQIINSLRHDFDEWPDYVALADVADALESQENSHD